MASETWMTGSGYFAVKRFDRQGDKKIHMVSVSGLLETSHRIPNLDYNQLMKLTFILTKSYEEVEKMYRLMCLTRIPRSFIRSRAAAQRVWRLPTERLIREAGMSLLIWDMRLVECASRDNKETAVKSCVLHKTIRLF